MDIFEYIDRVKANFDKKPEPRYNMKKYFMGGSVTTPKRGLVDEPGSYSFTEQQLKNVEKWKKRFKSAVDKGLTKPYEELTKKEQYDIRQGRNVGFPREPVGKFKFKQVNQSGTYYVDVDPFSKTQRKNVTEWEKANNKNFEEVTNLNTRYAIKTKGAKYKTRPEIQYETKVLKTSEAEKRAIELLNQGNDKVTVANKLEAEGLIKIRQNFDISKGKKTKSYGSIHRDFDNLLKDGKLSIDEIAERPIGGKLGALEQAARDKKILDTIAENPHLNPEQIAKRLKLSGPVVHGVAKKNKIILKSKYDQLAPEVKELDKLIKQNVKFLTGDSNFAEKRKVLLDGMKKKFGSNYSVGDLQTRLNTIGNQYLGNLNVKAYQDIKAPKNYKNSAIHNNIVGLAKGDWLGVVSEAKLLGLPKNQVQLLEDVLGGASKLTKMKVAGDHTDINAMMKNFPEYKKNFTRINIISNRLNQEKALADRKLINLVQQLNNKEITSEEFRTKVNKVRTDFTTKTKVPIGNPVTDARGNVSLDFQTDRIIDLKNPKNKVIAQAVTNLIEQEGVKFSDFDIQYSQANTIKDRLNLLKNATTEALQKSKIIKGFAEMSGDVGQAAKTILKTKSGKIGAAGLLYTLATAQGPRPTETNLIEEVALTKGEPETKPLKYLPGYGDAAIAGTGAAIGSKYTKADPLKQARRFPKNILGKIFRTLGTPLSGPLWASLNIYDKMKKGESLGEAVMSPLTGAELAFPSLFTENVAKITKNPTAQRILNLGGLQRVLGPVGTGITTVSLLKDRAKAMSERGEDISKLKDIIKQQEEIEDFAAGDYRGYLAGGGIAKLAGKSSGPPPEKGPQSQGLAYFMKNGKR